MAMSRDAHTGLVLNGDAAAAFGFLQYSLAFRWLDDGVFVTAAPAPYAQALGARLVAVGVKAKLLGDRVLLIGEPTGEPPTMDGNAVGFVLPGSGMTGQYSTQFFPPPSGFPDGPLVVPDIPVTVRSTDYFARFDPVMSAILARSSGAPAAPSGNVVTVNAASFRPDQGMAPGSLASAFGTFSTVPDQVLVAGVMAQIVATNASQVNFVMPGSVAPGRIAVSVRAAGQELAAGEATLTAAGPGIFVAQPGDPSQPGAVENQDDSPNSGSNPAARGSIVQIYATGYGPGSSQVQVFFADTPAQVMYSGLVGPGLWQINAQVPDGASGQVPVSIIAGNISSNAVTVWVQ